MNDDLVKRLRQFERWDPDQKEAADEIERMRAALQEIVWLATPDHEEFRTKVWRTAMAALEGTK
jgi:hypothetical protein